MKRKEKTFTLSDFKKWGKQGGSKTGKTKRRDIDYKEMGMAAAAARWKGHIKVVK